MMGRARHGVAAFTGLVLGLLAIGPGLAPGFVLSFDMVFVPDPAFSRMTFGLTGTVPRHVPSDAFVTALATVLPADAVQKLVLLAIFVMACTAAASLVPSERLAPRLAAGVLYAWNPFVAERLLLGHWAFLLGYAALPWVVGAAARAGEAGGGRRLVRALIPAAIGGFAAIAISALTALAIAAAGRERGRSLGRTAVALVVLSLPWLVTGWLRPAGMPGDTVGVEAFAARADTPFGALGSLFLLGGAWNRETVPAGYGAPVTAFAWLLVVVAAVVAYGWWCRTAWARGVALAAGAGFVLAALGAVVPWLLRWAIGLWPGFAVLRDGQQYVAPLAVLVAVGLGVLVERVMRVDTARTDTAGAALAIFAILAPVVLLPSLAWGAAGRLKAVDYPAAWAAGRKIIEADTVPGDVLVLPWATYRSYSWNGGRTSLDALPRYLGRRVIVSDAVMIGSLTIRAEDPRARRLDEVVRAGGPLTEGLRAAGIRYVALDAETSAANPARGRLAGADPVLDQPDLVLYRIEAPVKAEDGGAPVWSAVLAWSIVMGVILWSFFVPASTLSAYFPRRPRRRRTP
ncbi:hypothetical protein [Actinomadura rudentiformis]|uniref:hypothetical protein n=1 Tax=Actinomadura rudentiformis TaxID=359158 RepID=UPI00178C250B|nr:hypothetical protein [Actinomadura rudentiformis]